MSQIKILWVDDEIDLLKPHITFLSEKGYNVTIATNGNDAIQRCKSNHFDLIFLDENMPGLSGLETLGPIKNIHPELPVIMITKSEEESIMDEAIGAKITDYLIKPVNPNQILLAIKKIIDNKRLVSEKTTSDYQQEFRNISLAFSENLNFDEWVDLYKKLVHWEMELESSEDASMNEVFAMQKVEANSQFSKFVEANYGTWITASNGESPLMSHNLFKEKIKPLVDGNTPVFMILIDNLRYDQWKILQHIVNEYFIIENDEMYCSILPTATQFSRNSIFAGMLPSNIQKTYPNLWQDDVSEEGKNLHEETFLNDQIKRLGLNTIPTYNKVTNHRSGKQLTEKVQNMMTKKLNIIVYNFVDMLSHARTDMEIIKELASDEAAYRSVTRSWFEHSYLTDILKQLSENKVKVIITTDHGSIRVKTSSKVIGDKNTSSNLRYKHGKNLQYNPKEVMSATNPSEVFLPKPHLTSSYIFAKEDKYFVYPNNYNYYVKFYNDTFQHGGISMEEMLIPIITLSSK